MLERVEQMFPYVFTLHAFSLIKLNWKWEPGFSITK